MKATSFKAGTQLIKENEESRRMFIIQRGKARVFKNYMSKKVTLAVLGEGEVFGELSFFDAEPRSASVEALTDLEAIVIESTSAHINDLPDWVLPILRSTFRRFRDADHKIMLLQSMNEYQKRVFKTDTVSKTIYLELLRFLKAFKLICEDSARTGPLSYEEVYQSMDEVLGSRMINLRVFFTQLNDHALLERKSMPGQKGTVLVIDEPALSCFTDYLTEETQSERYLLLSHTAVALLRRIVGFIDGGKAPATPGIIRVPIIRMEVAQMAFVEESIKELEKYKILRREGKELLLDPVPLHDQFVYQVIIKGFDHSAMTVD